jgi:hypothetical protein
MNFLLQPGERGIEKPTSSRRITVAQLSKPAVKGLTIRSHPDWVLDANLNVDNLEVFDSGVARCRQTKRLYTCLVKSGYGVDYRAYGWLFDSIVNKFTGDALFWGLHLTGFSPTGVSEELHYTKITENIFQTYARLIDLIPLSVPRVLIAVSPKDPAGCKRIVDRAASRFGRKKVVPKINSLHVGSSMSAPQVRLLIELGKLGHPIGFEDLCSAVSNPQRYEGTVAQGEAKAKTICQAAGQLYSDCYHARYMPDLPLL